MYNAQAYIPNLISDDDLANTHWYILYGYSLKGKDTCALNGGHIKRIIFKFLHVVLITRMKATDQIHICPYTGLRSFTEEESLYFKGRDLQTDQITALLEQNKFLMVTGASGEGKSSLIYGGLIPNARAGFFKAKYTNWVIADFRPERNPVANMAISLWRNILKQARQPLKQNSGVVIHHSLICIPIHSFYAGEEDESWNELTDQEKKARKRKAANLMIIVDQFEEFFTNPENFYNESPSNDSQIVVNLVLETARIAIKKKPAGLCGMYHAVRLYRAVFRIPRVAGIHWIFAVFCSPIKKKRFKTSHRRAGHTKW